MLGRARIAVKILAPVVGLSLLVALVIVTAIRLQATVAEANRKADALSAEVIEASEVRALSRAIQRDALKMTIDLWSDKRGDLGKSIDARSQQLVERARRLTNMAAADATPLSPDFLRLQQTVVSEIAAVKAAALANEFVGARSKFLSAVQVAEKAASKETDKFIESGEEKARVLVEDAERTQDMARLIMIVVGLAALVGGLAASAAIAFRGIISPMRRVMAAMARVSAGDLASSIDGAERRDEIGDIAKAVASIRDAAIEKERLERQAAELRAQTEAERARNESDRQRNEAELAAVVGALASNLVRIAQCDLTTRIDEDFGDRYQQIKLDFNAAVSRLEATVRGVVTSVQTITASSQQISVASDDLSRRTEQQASTLEESTAAMAELARAVNTTAESATWTKDTISIAKAATDESIAVVHQTVAAMDRILGSSKHVSQIVGVIDEIAFQTNLLALNAGVEAARAGDAGRGFAVVASEVRTLALRSTEAAKQIKALISQSASDVSNGVELVGATGDAFARIKDQIAIIDKGIAEITSRALDQSTTIKQVNSAIFEIDQATQQNASMAEEATAGCRSLAEESNRLADTVREFNVGEAEEVDSAQESKARSTWALNAA